MTRTQETFFELVTLALGHRTPSRLTEPEDWKELIGLCKRQELSALCTDGLQKLYENVPGFKCGLDSQRMLRIEWFSDTVNCETEHLKHAKVIAKLADFYGNHGLRMMLLKGHGLSLNYPVPSHRESGDIDIFLLGHDRIPAWKTGDNAIEKELGIKVDNSHHHHSVFRFKGKSVENHFDFINTVGHKSSRKIELVLKDLAFEKQNEVLIEGKKVYLPSENLNALFLAKHCALHFASEKATFRQILDWAAFVAAFGQFVDWEMIRAIYRKYNLENFVGIINRIAVEHLGYAEDAFPFLSQDEKTYRRVLNDILSPEFKEKERPNLISALYVKPRRWWANRWKHRLCYSDSLFSGFCHSMFAKIIKPSHFIH